MTTRILHPFTVSRTADECDGCHALLLSGTWALVRSDGAVFCTSSCEAAHPDAKPRDPAAASLHSSGL